MEKRHKIWKPDIIYSVLRRYVDWCTKSSYSSLTVVGKENIPTDGAVLLAPNHCNTMMDALVVLQADRGPSGYGARADLFRKPLIASTLRWLRILPLARARDGRSAVAGNEEIFDEVVECIDHKVPFCMFSEGTHRAKHSLMPLKKGIWRVAVRAAKRLDKPVYVVPVGIDYDDYFRYMKRARVSFGEPIRVYEDTDQREFLDTLYKRISGLITYFPDDEDYDKNWNEWKKAHTPVYTPLQQAGRIALAVLSLPLFAVFAILCSPMWIIAAVLGSKLDDKAWFNTIRYCTKFALMPLLLVAIGIPAFIYLPWYWAAVLLLLVLMSHSGFYFLQDFYRSILNIE
ncbi:MAG: 1-acyl-sn-glycerol-3-phosphate acyltransferase [Bacteroidales bacterium]|nr:1-acyl-sn-glycerol-3-phosphate acyltransferase [Bacteroidales bacterium]